MTERRNADGFTMIELLLAMAITASMLILISNVVQSVSHASRHGQNIAEVYSSACGVLDTISRDLENALIRDDIPSFTSGTKSLDFYTRLPGIAENGDPNDKTPVRRISLVRYDFSPLANTADTTPVLQRSDLSISWAQKDRLVVGSTNTLPAATSGTATFGDGILGFDYMFLLENGTATRVLSPDGPKVRAVRFTVALLDSTAAKLLKNAQRTNQLVTLFSSNKPAAPNSTKDAWNQALAAPSVWDGIPGAAHRRLKVYERIVVLPQS